MKGRIEDGEGSKTYGEEKRKGRRGVEGVRAEKKEKKKAVEEVKRKEK